MKKGFAAVFILAICQSCFLFTGGNTPKPIPVEPDPLPEFQSTPTLYKIQPGPIDEASGMVPSASMPGHLWVHEDSGSPSELHLISVTGEYKGKIDLWAYNRDWEDIADGPGPEEGVNYLYLGDIGDNAENLEVYMIYRLKEPGSLQQNYPPYEEIRFKYADYPGGMDCEAMFVDPATKDIYLISKRQLFSVRVYRLKYPYSTTSENTAEFLGTLPLSLITAADISSDGREIIMKNYDAAYYWRRKENEGIFEALSRTRDIGLPYYVEVQGEAICFDSKDEGYFTLSEKPYGTSFVNLQYYGRKASE